jgi:hypothetical protein
MAEHEPVKPPAALCVGSFTNIRHLLEGLGWDLFENMDEEDFLDLSKDLKERYVLKLFWRKYVPAAMKSNE